MPSNCFQLHPSPRYSVIADKLDGKADVLTLSYETNGHGSWNFILDNGNAPFISEKYHKVTAYIAFNFGRHIAIQRHQDLTTQLNITMHACSTTYNAVYGSFWGASCFEKIYEYNADEICYHRVHGMITSLLHSPHFTALTSPRNNIQLHSEYINHWIDKITNKIVRKIRPPPPSAIISK